MTCTRPGGAARPRRREAPDASISPQNMAARLLEMLLLKFGVKKC